MNEQLVKFETAKLAKEKEFKLALSSDNLYFNDKGIVHNYHWFNSEELVNYIDAPTQSLLQKWLRDIHNIHIEIFLSIEKPYNVYYFRFMEVGKYFTLSYDNIPDNTKYEEVLELALIETLKKL